MAFNQPFSFKAWFIDPLGPLQLNNLPPSLSQVLDRLTLETCRQVLTHASIDKECNYEHLEYVGDSILQVAATLFLERRYYPKLSRSENYTIRTLIVGKTTLSQISLALGLHARLRTGSSATPPTQGIIKEVFEALLGGICRDFELQEAVRWCGEVLGAVWEENEAYFVRDQLVRDRYGIPSAPFPPNLLPAPQLSSSASPPSAPPPAPPSLDLPSRRTTTGVDHSKSELTRVCSALHLSLDYEPVSSTKMPEGGVVWVKRARVGDGKFVAEGTGWTMRAAQSAAAANVLQRRELQGVPKLKRKRVK